MRIQYDNILFLKGNWYKTDRFVTYKDGRTVPIYEKKICLSMDFMRHNIFQNDFPYQSPNLYAYLDYYFHMRAQVGSILRGEMSTDLGFKKKSSISITPAEQTNNAVATFEFCSRSGSRGIPKVEEKEKEELAEDVVDDEDAEGKDAEGKDVAVNKEALADNSVFQRETVGRITYSGKGAVDFFEMCFLSLSEHYDRLSSDIDSFNNLFRPKLEKTIGSVSDPKYYIIKNSAILTPELGVVLNNDQILFLTREFFKRLLRFRVTKAGGYVEMTGVRIKYVVNPLKDRMNSDDGWIDLKGIDDIMDINFQCEQFYEERDDEEAKGIIAIMDAEVARKNDEKRKNKKDKKDKIEAAKAAKATKATSKNTRKDERI